MSSVLTHTNIVYSEATVDSYDDRSIGCWAFDGSVSEYSGPIHLDVSGPFDGSGHAASIRLSLEQATRLRDFLNEAFQAIEEAAEKASEESEEPENYEEYIDARFARPKLSVSNGWDPEYPQTSLVYDADGKCIGQLVSVDPDVIASSPGLQKWSIPTR